MALGTILAGVGLASGIASLFTGGKTSTNLGRFGELSSAGSNYFNSLDNQQYNRNLQKQAWARDDSYYQRLVNDLTTAGLNPAVAAEKSAQSSSFHSSDPVQTESQVLEDMVKSQMTMNQQQFDNAIHQSTADANNALTLAKAEEQMINNAILQQMIADQPGGIKFLSNMKHDMMISNLARSNSYVANMAKQNDLLNTQIALNDAEKIIKAEQAGLISKQNASYYLRTSLDYVMKGVGTAANVYGAYNYGRFNDSYSDYVDALSRHYGEMDDLNLAKFNYYTMGGGSNFL